MLILASRGRVTPQISSNVNGGVPQGESLLDNGGTELQYDLFKGGCTYWFFTDASGKIVTYRYRVNRLGTCKPIG
jgi:hypothetical protein